MDLKNVVQNVKEKADEAVNSFHAGHHDNAKHYLAGIRAEIVEYERENPPPADDVTKSVTSETPAEVQAEKPAEVPGEPAQPGAAEQPGPALPASQFQAPSKPPQ